MTDAILPRLTAKQSSASPFRIPLAAPNLNDDDREAVRAALVGKQIVPGPSAGELERAMAGRLGMPHAVALSSGTAALHVALLAAGVGPETDVCLPALTYVAPANAIRFTGAHPVLLDAEARHRQLDADRMREYLRTEYRSRDHSWISQTTGRRLGAIVAVDLLGHPCDLDALIDVSEEFGVVLIDDAAEALGATVRGRPVGGIAPVATLSFNANKTITGAGGGMLLCSDDDFAMRARQIATQGRKPGSREYLHEVLGLNYVMPASQAALALSQMRRLDEFVERKREIGDVYADTLADLPVRLPVEADWARASLWLYTIHLDTERREEMMDALAAQGIESRPMFGAIHRLEAHAGSPRDDCPVAEELAASGLSLPCSTDIKNEEIEEVATVIRALLAPR